MYRFFFNRTKSSKITYILLSLIIFFCSCAGIHDKAEDLGDGYVYIYDGGDLSYIRASNPEEGNAIYPKVIDYTFNKDFVLILQDPHKERIKSLLAHNLRSCYTYYVDSLKNKDGINIVSNDHLAVKLFKGKISTENTESDIILSEKIVDSLMNATPYYQKMFTSKRNYWILVKSADQLFGPYSMIEYTLKRKELKIPDDLALD